MLKTLLTRLRQGNRTMAFPDGAPPALPAHFRGAPKIDATKCPDGCRECAEHCPTDAIVARDGNLAVDLGRCLFCPECERACPEGAIEFTDDYRLAYAQHELDDKLRKLFGRSLDLRVVSAGDCNACAADVNVLTTIGWDIGRFGIRIVASPRHADGLLVVGPLTEAMRGPLMKTYEAIAEPKIVIAVGACAISGGPFADQHSGVAGLLPVDLFIPGCPPHPLTILDGLLRLLGRLETRVPLSS